jgi:bifunctional N-acetylglucosamine-1-phosphate-uridyltransferase/glucosamine-1-phosphate-acetyltransferase GlmU-like protein
MKIITIVPAAGKGSRVNFKIPKILLNIGKKKIIDIIINKIDKVSDKIIFIVKSEHKEKIKNYLNKVYKNKLNYELVIQKKPLGMAHAVYQSKKFIKKYQKIMVIWGDHIGVAKSTILKVCSMKIKNNTLILPVVKKKNLYVQFQFNKNKLIKIKEKREGDECDNIGFSDVGTFVFQSKHFSFFLQKFKSQNILGKVTKEQNFLPFLFFLSKKKWLVKKVIFKNSIQSHGINTRLDIKTFKKIYEKN